MDIGKLLKQQIDLLSGMKRDIDKNLLSLKKDYMHLSIKEYFVLFPAIESISWSQYTPYFNDGDSCTFSSHHEWADLTFTGPIRLEDKEIISEEILDFLSNFTSDDMESMFGDHVTVTITKDTIVTAWCDHD